MINKAKEEGEFLPGFLTAILTLLKKEGATEGSMKSFRPLSLMNLDYKILSKTLCNRLMPIMNQIIHHNQTYCVPGRMIHDNIHLIRSIIEHQQRIRDPFGIISWDQEKAFDRVDHGYLMAALRSFGFGNSFVKWIALLYKNSTFRIRFNGHLSSPINFRSGVHQGCALSAALFIIALEPLLHRIRTNELISGIESPGARYQAVQQIIDPNKLLKDGNFKIKVLGYADDLNTIVKDRNEELETIKMLDLFNKSSGGKTNTNKTEILWVSDWLPPPSFRSEVRTDWCTFLGVPLDTFGCIPRVKLKEILTSIKQIIAMWSSHDLSFTERCTVLKTFILSKIMYVINFIRLSNNTLINLQKTFNNFFWKNKRPSIAFKPIVGKKCDGGIGLVLNH